MQEVGIDISGNNTDSVFEFFKQGRSYDYVIAVCDTATAERCPLFPGVSKRLYWSFSNPADFVGKEEEVLVATRKVRNQIKEEVEKFIGSFNY